jgi:hypothetical protein
LLSYPISIQKCLSFQIATASSGDNGYCFLAKYHLEGGLAKTFAECLACLGGGCLLVDI